MTARELMQLLTELVEEEETTTETTPAVLVWDARNCEHLEITGVSMDNGILNIDCEN